MTQIPFELRTNVRHVSGGPAMYVMERKTLHGVEILVCKWYDGKKWKSGEFPETELMLVRRGPPIGLVGRGNVRSRMTDWSVC